MTYYYVYPFGQDADDLTTISTTATIDGTVSYQTGFTPNYQYDQNTNPNAKPIPRGQFNQLIYQITQNVQQYQQYGAPNWITSADNEGSPYPYDINATVYYNNKKWINLTADNTATPGADSTWLDVSGYGNGFLPGMTMDWSGPIAPVGWAVCDGSTVSRTTYETLLNNITQQQTGTLTSGNAVISGLTDTSKMYSGMPIEGTGIPAATTILSVDSGTQITMSDDATTSGTQSIRFFYWGAGNGSTTFNLPISQGYVSAGAGASGFSFGSIVGQFGGSQTHTIALEEMPQHTHNPKSPATNFQAFGTSGAGNFNGGVNLSGTETTTGNITGWTSQSAMNIVQPTVLYNKIIRLI